MSAHKQYLGDSVYVDWRRGPLGEGELVLTTENGGMPGNTIVLEAEVFAELLKYIEKWENKNRRIKTSEQ